MEVHILKFSPRIPLLIQKCMNGLYSEIKGQNHSTILQTRGIGLYTVPHPPTPLKVIIFFPPVTGKSLLLVYVTLFDFVFAFILQVNFIFSFLFCLYSYFVPIFLIFLFPIFFPSQMTSAPPRKGGVSKSYNSKYWKIPSRPGEYQPMSFGGKNMKRGREKGGKYRPALSVLSRISCHGFLS